MDVSLAPQHLFSAAEISFAWSLLAALVLGCVLGLERTIAGKHAGMRTYAMVSLGSCLFTIVGTLASYQLVSFSGINPLQIAGSIVIGIGFIGSGLAALRSQDNHMELTTASGIWVAAGIGMACGYGLYLLAAVTTVLAIIAFSFFLHVENRVRKSFDVK